MGIMMVKSFVFNYLCFRIVSIKFIISSPAFYVSLLKTDSAHGCTMVLLPLYTFLSLFPILTKEFISIWSGCRGLESCNKKLTFNANTIENFLIEHLMSKVQTWFQVGKRTQFWLLACQYNTDFSLSSSSQQHLGWNSV